MHFNWAIFRPHRRSMYVDAAYCYRQSRVVCQSVTSVSPTKNGWTDQDFFWCWTLVGPRKHVLGAVHSAGATWRIPLNHMCGGSAACCQITLIACYFAPRWGTKYCILVCLWSVWLSTCISRQVSAVADESARRDASRQTCCNQMWASAINLWPN